MVATGDDITADWANSHPGVLAGETNVAVVTGGAASAQAVTFPTGYFTNPPVVVCNVINTSVPQQRAAGPTSITAAGFTIEAEASTAGTILVAWIAVGN